METSRTPICPNCRSRNVKSNRGHDHSGRHGAHAAHAAQHLGGAGPLVTIAVGLGTWLFGKVAHTATAEWKCESCDHEFSGSAGGCVRCTGGSEKMFNLFCCGSLVCQPCLNDIGGPTKTTCELCNKPVVRR